jgi:hypothetical protein
MAAEPRCRRALRRSGFFAALRLICGIPALCGAPAFLRRSGFFAALRLFQIFQMRDRMARGHLCYELSRFPRAEPRLTDAYARYGTVAAVRLRG